MKFQLKLQNNSCTRGLITDCKIKKTVKISTHHTSSQHLQNLDKIGVVLHRKIFLLTHPGQTIAENYKFWQNHDKKIEEIDKSFIERTSKINLMMITLIQKSCFILTAGRINTGPRIQQPDVQRAVCDRAPPQGNLRGSVRIHSQRIQCFRRIHRRSQVWPEKNITADYWHTALFSLAPMAGNWLKIFLCLPKLYCWIGVVVVPVWCRFAWD